LLKENPNKIDWYLLSRNPAIFRNMSIHRQSLYKLLENLRW